VWWAITYVILPSMMRRLLGNDLFANIPRTTTSAADGVTRR
jgi:hypothetical protein